MNLSCVLYETVMRYHYRDYIDKIWDQPSENAYELWIIHYEHMNSSLKYGIGINDCSNKYFDFMMYGIIDCQIPWLSFRNVSFR